jgi:glycogen operon protein
MIFQCLRHWVVNYHVDGFRFDLASILSRDRYGRLAANPPLVETIAEDPLLADTKIIAEAWDAAGSYQVGTFSHLRWAEWNGCYRDDVRRFWRGDHHLLGGLATRLAGSSDLYQSSCRQPYHGINFITAHDGFTMNDLVSYHHKHNHANGEENRDGEHHNNSLNFGVEGPTDDPAVERERLKQIKNLLATLLLSQGVPMLLFGDECRRTQKGNNNTYCQDNELSWFDWTLVEKHEDLVRFCRELIAFRKAEPTVRRTEFLTGRAAGPDCLPDVSWFDPDGKPVAWDRNGHSLMCLLGGTPVAEYDEPGREVLILIHAGPEPQTFHLPANLPRKHWRLFADTAAESPADVFPNGDGPPLLPRGVTLAGRSLRCYVG